MKMRGCTNATPPRRLLLVTMPLAEPILPNLAVEQLAAMARDAGEPCDILYGTLLLPCSVPQYMIHAMAGPSIFAPAYHGLNPEDVAVHVTAALVDGHTKPGEEAFESAVTDFLLAMDAADQCITSCLAAIPPGRFDVVGFSVGFDAQKLPSALLARRLKEREWGVKILFGGTGCDGEMGPAVLEAYPQIDMVVQGDAERTFLPAVAALRGMCPPTSVPGCVYRDGGDIRATAPAIPSPDIDELPPVDYANFLEQRSSGPYASSPLVLLFESSRGCWWGERHHCRFCGIRAVSHGYRRRGPRETLAAVERLSRHSPDLLYATDAILDLAYLQTVLPEWARMRREGVLLSFFYEIKSNMRREQVALLAAAGVLQVQPGIESFSTNVLRLMDKGTTGLQQIELLKWAQAYGITPVYGLLVGTPGERLADLESVIGLMPRLHHLPPPAQVNRLALHRFSPYAASPEQWGFRDIRPYPVQRIIYGLDDALITRLCYEWAYTLDEQERPALVDARHRLGEALRDWHRAYLFEERLLVTDSGSAVNIVRRSGITGLRSWRLTGFNAEVYRHAQRVSSAQSIARELREDEGAVAGVLDQLAGEGLVALMDGRCLALAVPVEADAWRDAKLDWATRSASSALPVIAAPMG